MTGPAGELVLYLGLGQSLMAQTPRSRPLGEPPGPLDPARAWVLSPTGEPRFLGLNPLMDLPETALDGLHPHQRWGRSGPLTAASDEILRVLGPADRLLTVNLARRGASVRECGPGSGLERNVRRCLDRAAGLARDKGLRFDRVVVSFIQGQTDARRPRRLYHARLGQMLDALVAATAEATGGAGRLLFCLSQATASAPVRLGAPLAQLDLAFARPDLVVMAGPEYMLARSDGLHLTPQSAVHLGMLHGRAIARRLTGGTWAPLHVVRATARGADVTVSLAGGIGPLVAHDPSVTAPPVQVGARAVPDLGFRWLDPQAPETRILEARISAPREVLLRLSATAGPGSHLALGLPADPALPEGFRPHDPAEAQGGCTNLCTEGDGSTRLGLPARDWAVQQVVAVTLEPGV